jgi:hypothetical protein
MTLFEQILKDKRKPFDIIKISIKNINGFRWEEYQVLDIPDKLLFAECIKLRGKYQVDLSPIYEDNTKTANE